MTTQATLSRDIATQAPWQIDTAHTEVEFSVRHLMLSNVKGRFGQIAGMVAFDESGNVLEALDVRIPVATIDTRMDQRDAHLRSPDFFDAEKYPVISFTGRRVRGSLNDAFKLVGDLTLHGVMREVVLDVTLEGSGTDPWGNERRGYSATGKIDRRDFGLTWNQALETGGVAVGHEVKITINTEIMRPMQKD